MPAPEFVIEFDADQAIAALHQWPARVTRATSRALNRALTTGRAEMARRVASDMGMKIRDAKEAIFMDTPRPGGALQGRLVASLRRRPLYDFKPRQVARGVSHVTQGGGRIVVPGAFIAAVETGHTGTKHWGVFKRNGKFGRRGDPRLERIEELLGVSIGLVFDRHRNPVAGVIKDAFEKNLEHELAFAAKESA